MLWFLSVHHSHERGRDTPHSQYQILWPISFVLLALMQRYPVSRISAAGCITESCRCVLKCRVVHLIRAIGCAGTIVRFAPPLLATYRRIVSRSWVTRWCISKAMRTTVLCYIDCIGTILLDRTETIQVLPRMSIFTFSL